MQHLAMRADYQIVRVRRQWVVVYRDILPQENLTSKFNVDVIGRIVIGAIEKEVKFGVKNLNQ